MPGLSAGKSGDVGTAESEAPRVQPETLGTYAETDLDCTDVARLDDHVGERQHAVVVMLVFIDHARAEPDDARIGVDHVGRLEQLLLECGRCRDDLERRARLVQILDGAVAAIVVAEASIGVRVESRIVRQRKDLAGARIHHDRGAALGARLLDTPAWSSRSAMCCRYSSIVSSRSSAGRRRSLDPAECVALGVGLDEHRARVSFDQIVIRRLDAREPGVVESHVSEHVRGQLLVRDRSAGFPS